MRTHLAALLAPGIVLGFLAVPVGSFSVESTPLPLKAATPPPHAASAPSPSVPLARTASPPAPVPFSASPDHTLLLHKPRIPTEWGRVIQYHHETITSESLFNSEKETIHEFVLQGTDGILRVAFYHEPPSEGAYWVVWIWDQP